MLMKNSTYRYAIVIILIIIITFAIIQKTYFSTAPSFHSSYYTQNITSPYNNNSNNASTKKNKTTYLENVVLSKNYNLPFFSRPVVTGDFSFIDTANYFATYGVTNPNYIGYVVKINNDNGDIVWKSKLPNMIMNTPLVVPQMNMVFVGIGNDEFFYKNNTLYRGTGTSGVYALDIQTGKILWKFSTIGQRKPTLIYNKGIIYSVGGNRILYAISAQTGKEIWSLDYGSITSQGSPVLVGNNLFFGGAKPYKLFDVNIDTHKIVWVDNLGSTNGINGGLDDTTIASSSGYLYTMATKLVDYKTNQGYDYLFKINESTGAIVWRFNEGYGKMNLPNGAQMEGTVPTITKNNVYVGSTSAQKIFDVSVASGKKIWSQNAIGLNNKPFVIVGDNLYYDNGLGNILVYNRETGRYLAERTTGGQVAVSGITYSDGYFYADNSSGRFFVFK